MIAAFQTLPAQVVGDLVRTLAELGEGEPGLAAGRDVDDPQRAAILAGGSARELEIGRASCRERVFGYV